MALITIKNGDSAIAALLSKLPEGALQSWGQLEYLSQSSNSPIYMLVINEPDNNPILQFKDPKGLKVTQDAAYYLNTNERVATKEYFNKGCASMFMIFDNYMHLKAFELKLKDVGYTVHVKKF